MARGLLVVLVLLTACGQAAVNSPSPSPTATVAVASPTPTASPEPTPSDTPTIVPYVESAYRAGQHRGFGEFHLNVGQITLPVVKNVIAFAQQKNLFLQAHADARAVAELLDYVGADQIVLWAHAGVTATPAQID